MTNTETRNAAAPIVDVYITSLPKDKPIGTVGCIERASEILSVSNETVRREKYFVWRLLCYALNSSFGLSENELKLRKNRFGGWSLDQAYVSLSHSGGALAVAVSSHSVGIDIERMKEVKGERRLERILCAQELTQYNASENKTDHDFIKIWTAKEAIFKSKNLDVFIPQKTNTVGESYKTESILISDVEYAWSAATPYPEKIRVFTNITLD